MFQHFLSPRFINQVRINTIFFSYPLGILFIRKPVFAKNREVGINKKISVGIWAKGMIFSSNNLLITVFNHLSRNRNGMYSFLCQFGALFFVIAFQYIIHYIMVIKRK